jgi:hypothetical protein
MVKLTQMNSKKLILLVLLVLLLSSCKGLIYSVILPKKPELKVLYNEEKDKTLAFIPMYHIAKPLFYRETKKIVDSLRKKGYTVFYEGMGLPDAKKPSPQEDTLLRKFRRLLGIQVGDYTNKENKTLPNFMTSGKYVAQTHEIIGVGKEKDFNIDVPADMIIQGHEKEYGEIKLNQCDWKTDFFDEYDCHDDPLNYFYAIYTLRENYIIKKNYKFVKR